MGSLFLLQRPHLRARSWEPLALDGYGGSHAAMVILNQTYELALEEPRGASVPPHGEADLWASAGLVGRQATGSRLRRCWHWLHGWLCRICRGLPVQRLHCPLCQTLDAIVGCDPHQEGRCDIRQHQHLMLWQRPDLVGSMSQRAAPPAATLCAKITEKNHFPIPNYPASWSAKGFSSLWSAAR